MKSVHDVVKELFITAQNDKDIANRVAWMIGKNISEMEWDKNDRRAYVQISRQNAPFYSDGGTPVYLIKRADDLYECCAQKKSITFTDIYKNPLGVMLGRKKRQKRSIGSFYRKSGLVVEEEVARYEIQEYEKIKEAIKNAGKEAQARERIKIELERRLNQRR